jgi:CheY-like chemotaxis protein
MIEPLCADKNISFETNFKTSDVVVIADKTKMNQIFINLLSNAAKFTPNGGTIKMSCEAVNIEEDYVDWHSMISDNGCGMSESFQRVMFLPFEQEDNQFTANLTGTGLGLTIVKMNVDAMKGKITVDSRLGEGTTFHLFLRTKKEKSIKQAKMPDQTDFSVLTGKRVLLVEDNRLNMEIARRILAKKQVCATSAFNGQEAVDIFDKETEGSFDAVLMDIRMPVMDGLEATRKIRSLNKKDAKTIPIIAMSANAFNEDIENGRKAGMNEYISKPVEPERLFTVLANSFRGCDL